MYVWFLGILNFGGDVVNYVVVYIFWMLIRVFFWSRCFMVNDSIFEICSFESILLVIDFL